MFSLFLGVAETPGLHTGQARQLPAGGGLEGKAETFDYWGQALQARDSG